jgi:hypothetical protein
MGEALSGAGQLSTGANVMMHGLTPPEEAGFWELVVGVVDFHAADLEGGEKQG